MTLKMLCAALAACLAIAGQAIAAPKGKGLAKAVQTGPAAPQPFGLQPGKTTFEEFKAIAAKEGWKIAQSVRPYINESEKVINKHEFTIVLGDVVAPFPVQDVRAMFYHPEPMMPIPPTAVLNSFSYFLDTSAADPNAVAEQLGAKYGPPETYDNLKMWFFASGGRAGATSESVTFLHAPTADAANAARERQLEEHYRAKAAANRGF